MRDMAELTKAEQVQVVKVLVLCSILDGRLRGRERKLYEQVPVSYTHLTLPTKA